MRDSVLRAAIERAASLAAMEARQPAARTVDLAADVAGALPIANGGTGQVTALAAFDAIAPTRAKGGMILRDGSTSVALAVGPNGTVLFADSGEAAGVRWLELPAQLPTASAKGDLAVWNGTNWAILPVGANGTVLTADSTQATGLKWA